MEIPFFEQCLLYILLTQLLQRIYATAPTHNWYFCFILILQNFMLAEVLSERSFRDLVINFESLSIVNIDL